MVAGVYNITVLVGETLSLTFSLFADQQQQTPFNLTGFTVAVMLEAYGSSTPLVLVSGSGLTIATPSNGTVVVGQMIDASFAQGPGRWWMTLTDGSGNVLIPVHGVLEVSPP